MARRDPLKFRTLEEWFALPDRVRDAHERSVAAKHEMEAHGVEPVQGPSDGIPLDSRTFMRHAGTAVEEEGCSIPRPPERQPPRRDEDAR